MNYFNIIGYISSVEIMGFFENEIYYCKFIIDLVVVYLFIRKRSLKNVIDLVILCFICFKYFFLMYQCVNYVKRDYNENVYGVGKVVR